MNKIFATIFFSYISIVFADDQQATEKNKKESQLISKSELSINPKEYIQNPYIGLPSGGGTHEIDKSQLKSQTSLLSNLLMDGTWNTFAATSYVNQNGANNYGYGINIFGQTGQIGGFSIGGLMTVMNPFFSSQINPNNPSIQAQALPIAKQITPQELFLEYQYKNIFQIDAGWIGINNSPWMTYYQNNALNMVTYQGVVFNINPGYGWLLTGFAINGSQLLGEEGFSGQTMYNYTYDYGTATPEIGDVASNSTLALGANWSNSDNSLNFRLWGYQFEGYSNLLYADTEIKLPTTNDLEFTLGFQGAIQGANNGANFLNNSGYGNSENSNMIGAQLGIKYKILSLQLGYNNIWGSSDGYQGGGLISPYTYQIASDPLYTSGWINGMIEKSAGQAYKIAPSLNLLNNQLVITPSYQYYANTAVPVSSEYDLQVSYNLASVKGLTLFAGYGYVTQTGEDGGNADIYQAQLMFSYLY